MGETTGKSYMTGPFWCGIETILRKLAIKHKVDVTIDSKVGLIFQTVFYTVSGPYHQVCGFNEELLRRYK